MPSTFTGSKKKPRIHSNDQHVTRNVENVETSEGYEFVRWIRKNVEVVETDRLLHARAYTRVRVYAYECRSLLETTVSTFLEDLATNNYDYSRMFTDDHNNNLLAAIALCSYPNH
jgi:hypothetical protein